MLDFWAKHILGNEVCLKYGDITDMEWRDITDTSKGAYIFVGEEIYSVDNPDKDYLYQLHELSDKFRWLNRD